MAKTTLEPAPHRPSTTRRPGRPIPSLISEAGAEAVRRFHQYFNRHGSNPNTRAAYLGAVSKFLRWAEDRRYSLHQLDATHVAGYLRPIWKDGRHSSAKLHLAAVRAVFDFLATTGVVGRNPAIGIRFGTRKAACPTPALPAEDASRLLLSLDASSVIGLRDRALMAVMIYSFARVSETIGMDVADYAPDETSPVVVLSAKTGYARAVPAHHRAAKYLDKYIAALAANGNASGPLFQTVTGRSEKFSGRRMSRMDALRMIKRRAMAAKISGRICCRSLTGSGIVSYLSNGGSIGAVKEITGLSSVARIVHLDENRRRVTCEEIKRIAI